MKRISALLGAILVVAAPLQPVAAGDLQSPSTDEFPWDEIRTAHFAVIFQDDMAELAGFIVTLFGDKLDHEYLRLSSLFQAELPPPISIRIYPSARQFQNLNADPSNFDPESTHAHVGTREIAIIVGNLPFTAIPVGNQEQVLNDLRYELAHLFVEEISNGQAPPGLAVGVASYARDPLETPEISDGVSRLNPGAAPPWPKIWEHENASLDQDIMLQSLSTVAFLVDQAGWPAFIQFIKRIPASEGYQQALEEIYDVGLADLESRWRNYLPYYKTDRWRSNVLHGIDLGTHRALIEAGAYSEAKRALAETIPVIEQAEDTDLLQEAHQLLEISELGVEAYALLRRSRQSILEGEFEVALDFLEQARSIYLQIGEDRYMDDIELYTVRAAEVLALREDLLEIQSREAAMTEADTARLVSIGERLGELGDTAGYASAKQNLANVSARRNSRLILISFISLLVSFGLIAHRTHLIRREGAPESKLT